jgi:hypothetical protein
MIHAIVTIVAPPGQRRLRSETYGQLLLTMELAAEPPEVRFPVFRAPWGWTRSMLCEGRSGHRRTKLTEPGQDQLPAAVIEGPAKNRLLNHFP